MSNRLLTAIATLVCAAVAIPAFGQSITPANAGQVTSPVVTVNNAPDDQNDPHVNGNIAVYTHTNIDGVSRVRYFDFTSASDAQVPGLSGTNDTMADVNAGRIVFARTFDDRTDLFLYDLATSNVAALDP